MKSTVDNYEEKHKKHYICIYIYIYMSYIRRQLAWKIKIALEAYFCNNFDVMYDNMLIANHINKRVLSN